MMKILLFIFTIILTSNSISQSFGYFGKKNILRVNGLGATPIIANMMIPYSKFNAKKSYFEGGVNLNYARVVAKRFALGSEYSINWWKAPGPSTYLRYEKITSPSGLESYGYVNYKLNHERLFIQTQNFMPKIYFSPGKSLFLTIDCEFGIGYAQTKILDKSYFSEETLIKNTSYTFGYKKDYDPNKLYHSITVLYGINTKIPINRSLFFNFGLRYTHNLDNIIYLFDNSLYEGKGGDWYELISQRRSLTLFTANLGFMVVF